ncbi:agamous-like MADS-box protein AGL27 isoform X1 [Brassica rapa]|uniref:MAF3 n=1 Tax=Brassica rapa subsp. pekinensis TaxID=51351 RepID=A0A7T1TEI8_BRARP|nr:agamous-like MADS-box protein AGL27 isoform X1 [Brassica rapa]QPP11608.1 MAF3 [Brassica rapa subsp. pekinensis]
MGRKKVEIKRIENKSSRQVTFCKRRNGLIEKARQLSVLCESSVAVLVVSATGKLYNSSSGDNLSKIIDRYKIQQADDLQTLDLEEITRNYLPHKKLLELVQSNLEEANVDGVSVDSLNSLEEQLETALSVTRATKTKLMMEFLKTRREKEKLLIEENLVLASKVTEIWKQTFLVTRDETSMLPEYRFGNNPPETLSLLK